MKTTTRTRTGTRTARGRAKIPQPSTSTTGLSPATTGTPSATRTSRVRIPPAEIPHHRRTMPRCGNAERRGRKRRRDVSVGATRAPRRAGGGAARVGANPRRRAAATPTADAYDPDARDTPHDDLLEDDPGVEVAPPPSASDWITGRRRRAVRRTSKTAGGLGGWRLGGRTAGYAGVRLPRGAIDGPRLRATRLVISESEASVSGDGFSGYDADDLGDPCELDRDTIGRAADDEFAGCPGTAGRCSGTRTTARNLPIRSRARPRTRKNPRTRRVGG